MMVKHVERPHNQNQLINLFHISTNKLDAEEKSRRKEEKRSISLCE